MRAAWALSILCGLAASAQAANFLGVRYDGLRDEIVVKVAYRGTHGDHEFSVQWGKCRRLGDDNHEIVGRMIDGAWDDVAREEYIREVRFDLLKIGNCRPVQVTLYTAPGFHISVKVPAKPPAFADHRA